MSNRHDDCHEVGNQRHLPRPVRTLAPGRSNPNTASMRPPTIILRILLVTLALGCRAASAQESLPFPPVPSASTAGLTIQDSVHKKRVTPARLAPGSPNILILLMDDVGPGTPSTYGGEIHTPTLDRISKLGVSFNRFHSTAMCSPTRASLLTGRNHTRVGNGQICELANDWDGFSGTVPVTAPLAFTANDCLDLGGDFGSPVSPEYFDQAPFEFNGTLGTTSIRYIP
ncbi:MAG: sulfatase-like hydrolase/transferase [Verrucomicrobiales bacterium]|nr:sulfatase-like hydrolase/transferase [Verrucomicrobiales bacterium]